MSSYLKDCNSKTTVSIERTLQRLLSISVQIMIIFNIAFNDLATIMNISQMVPMVFLIISMFYSYYNNKYFMQYIRWWIVFVSICCISWLWACNPGSYNQQLISIVQCAVVGCTVMAAAQDKEEQKKLVDVLLLSGIILSLRLILVVPSSAWGSERVGVFIGYGNNRVGINLSFCSIFAVYRLVSTRKKWYSIICLLFIALTLFSGSKKSILGIFAGIMVVMLASSKNKKTKWRNLMISLIVFFGVYYSVTHVPILYDAIGSRFDALFSTLGENEAWRHSQSSSASRMYLIKEAWNVFLQYPILGVGLDGFATFNPLGAYAHVNYLELLCNLGIVGFLAYYSLWFKNIPFSISLIKKATKEERNGLALKLGILIYILVMDIGLVSFPIEPTHLAIALAVAIGDARRDDKMKLMKCKYIRQEEL